MIHRYRFISLHHATYGVARLCRVLAVKRRQGYYEWLAAQPARQQRAQDDDELAEQIRAIHGEHRGARVHVQRRAEARGQFVEAVAVEDERAVLPAQMRRAGQGHRDAGAEAAVAGGSVNGPF